MIPVSVVIPVKNEEANLPSCLDSVQDFFQIIVVDSASSDQTPIIANKYEVQLIDFEWNGKFPKKRNWVLHNYSFETEWVLFLDADEVLTKEFRKEIRTAIQDKAVSGYWLTYHNYFQNRLLKHGVKFRKLALFRVAAGEYERIDEDHWSNLDMEIHEHPIIEGKVGEIKAPINHQDYKGMHHYLARHNEYSSWEARRYIELNKKGPETFNYLTKRQQKKYRSLAKWWWPPAYFLMNYVAKLGFLDGPGGLTFSLLKAIYFYEIRCKIKELEKS